MIIGAHCIINSTSPEVDVAFFRDVFKLPSVNDGGYVIFGLPPAEVSVHDAERDGGHELFLMCDDVKAFVADMAKRNIACSPVQDQGWGLLTQITLPGGGKLGLYQPRHKRPTDATKQTIKPGNKAKK